jgi:hypothetical protein
MKNLTFKIEDSIAERFNNLTPEERERVERMLNEVLQEIFKRKQNQNLFALLERTSAQAAANGMTIAKLAEIMEWDDQMVKNLFGEEAIRNER